MSTVKNIQYVLVWCVHHCTCFRNWQSDLLPHIYTERRTSYVVNKMQHLCFKIKHLYHIQYKQCALTCAQPHACHDLKAQTETTHDNVARCPNYKWLPKCGQQRLTI